MRAIYILGILVLLALAVPAAPAHAGGVVTVCDEAHLLAALAGGGTVTFACSGTITLSNTITIAADTTVDGSGQEVTISGNDAVRVFVVSYGVMLNLNELTIARGSISQGHGGGIYNRGTVTVSNSIFSDNSAVIGGGIGTGGAIYSEFSSGALTVSNSTFAHNNARYCGGISTDGTLTVRSSTFVGNSAEYYGGAICFAWGGILTISNSTFSDNSAGYSNGGAIANNGVLNVSNSTFSGNHGGGLENFNGTMTLANTIVANNLVGTNCSGTITDGGGNLSFPDATCPGINADPLLGHLQDNGGPTWTMALGEGSAAIDAADDAICAAPPVNNLDQRGFVRPWGAHCDIGAVEQIQEPSAVSVSALRAQSLPGTITSAMVAGLLLLVLVAVGAQRRPRPMG